MSRATKPLSGDGGPRYARTRARAEGSKGPKAPQGETKGPPSHPHVTPQATLKPPPPVIEGRPSPRKPSRSLRDDVSAHEGLSEGVGDQVLGANFRVARRSDSTSP